MLSLPFVVIGTDAAAPWCIIPCALGSSVYECNYVTVFVNVEGEKKKSRINLEVGKLPRKLRS